MNRLVAFITSFKSIIIIPLFFLLISISFSIFFAVDHVERSKKETEKDRLQYVMIIMDILQSVYEKIYQNSQEEQILDVISSLASNENIKLLFFSNEVDQVFLSSQKILLGKHSNEILRYELGEKFSLIARQRENSEKVRRR